MKRSNVMKHVTAREDRRQNSLVIGAWSGLCVLHKKPGFRVYDRKEREINLLESLSSLLENILDKYKETLYYKIILKGLLG